MLFLPNRPGRNSLNTDKSFSLVGVPNLLHSALINLGFLVLAFPLAAQPYTVSSADGLNTAISSINTAGVPATLQFDASSIDLATLSSPPLGTLHDNTTLLDGTGSNNLTLNNSAQGITTALNSTALLHLTANYNFTLIGASYFGQDVNGNGIAGNSSAISAGALQLDPFLVVPSRRWNGK